MVIPLPILPLDIQYTVRTYTFRLPPGSVRPPPTHHSCSPRTANPCLHTCLISPLSYVLARYPLLSLPRGAYARPRARKREKKKVSHSTWKHDMTCMHGLAGRLAPRHRACCSTTRAGLWRQDGIIHHPRSARVAAAHLQGTDAVRDAMDAHMYVHISTCGFTSYCTGQHVAKVWGHKTKDLGRCFSKRLSLLCMQCRPGAWVGLHNYIYICAQIRRRDGCGGGLHVGRAAG